MASEGWDVGDVWEPQCSFTVGQTTVLGSPTEIYLYVMAPGSTSATEYTMGAGTVTYSTAGGYAYPTLGGSNPARGIPLTASGDWWCRYKGTGAIAAAAEASIEVRTQRVTT